MYIGLRDVDPPEQYVDAQGSTLGLSWSLNVPFDKLFLALTFRSHYKEKIPSKHDLIKNVV